MIRRALGELLFAVYPLLESATADLHKRNVGPLAAVELGLVLALLAGLAARFVPSRRRRWLVLLLFTSLGCLGAYTLAVGFPAAQAFAVWEYAVPRHDPAIFGHRGPAAYASDVLALASKLAALAGGATVIGGAVLVGTMNQRRATPSPPPAPGPAR